MPRAHLSKRLSDEAAIDLFCRSHITQVRRRKNGEIVGVKHVQFGWITPQRYYQLQKLHELMPLLQEVIRGGYQAKAWLWSVNVSVFGISVPVGTALPVIETWNLYAELHRTKKVTDANGVESVVPDIRWDEVFIRAYALLGPFGDVIQILDSAIALVGTPPQPNAFQPASLIPSFVDFFRHILTSGPPPIAGPVAPSPSP